LEKKVLNRLIENNKNMNYPISHWLKNYILPLTTVTIFLLFNACGSKQASSQETNRGTDQNNFRSDTASVQTAKVQPRDFTREVSSTGNLVAKQHAQLRLLVPG